MSHPDPHNDPDNTHPVRKFGKEVTFQGKTGIPKHKLRSDGGLETGIKRMLDLTDSERAKRTTQHSYKKALSDEYKSHAKPKIDMGKFPKARLEAMEKGYATRGRGVPIRYQIAAEKQAQVPSAYAKTKALRGKAGDMHKRSVDNETIRYSSGISTENRTQARKARDRMSETLKRAHDYL